MSSAADRVVLRAYPLEIQLACVRRELALRKAAYPKWVTNGRMKAEVAEHETNCMQAVHDTLSTLIEVRWGQPLSPPDSYGEEPTP